MSGMSGLVSAWACALAGFAALCLSTDRHGPQAFAQEPAWLTRAQPWLRLGGIACQGLSALFSVLASGGALGLVDYFGLALVCALAAVGLAAWVPRSLPAATLATALLAALAALGALLR